LTRLLDEGKKIADCVECQEVNPPKELNRNVEASRHTRRSGVRGGKIVPWVPGDSLKLLQAESRSNRGEEVWGATRRLKLREKKKKAEKVLRIAPEKKTKRKNRVKVCDYKKVIKKSRMGREIPSGVLV